MKFKFPNYVKSSHFLCRLHFTINSMMILSDVFINRYMMITRGLDITVYILKAFFVEAIVQPEFNLVLILLLHLKLSFKFQ